MANWPYTTVIDFKPIRWKRKDEMFQLDKVSINAISKKISKGFYHKLFL